MFLITIFSKITCWDYNQHCLHETRILITLQIWQVRTFFIVIIFQTFIAGLESSLNVDDTETLAFFNIFVVSMSMDKTQNYSF